MRGAPAANPGASLPLAPLGRRYAALGYESLVFGALALLAGFLSARFVTPDAMGETLGIPSPAGRALSAIVVFVFAGTYCSWSWSGGRRTLPMQTWHIALRRVDGGPVGAASALVRYVAAWVGPAAALALHAMLAPAGLGAHAAWVVALNFVWPAIDPERQFLHDRIAGTRIVMERNPERDAQRAGSGPDAGAPGRHPR